MIKYCFHLFISIMCLISIAGFAHAQQYVEDYEKRVVVHAEWGDEAGEMGLIPEILSGMTGGPQSLCVDTEGNIYVYDCGNYRVQVFASSGEIIRVFPVDHSLGTACLMKFDDVDYLWIHEYGHDFYMVYTMNGKLLKIIEYDDTQAPVVDFYVENTVIFSGNETLHVRQEPERILESGVPVYRADVVHHESPRHNPSSYGYLVVDDDAADPQRAKVILTETGTVLGHLDFSWLEPGYIVGYRGQNNDGDCFFLAHLVGGINGDPVYYIRMTDYNVFQVIEDMDILHFSDVYFGQMVCMGPDGALYVMSDNTDSGMDIIRWAFK